MVEKLKNDSDEEYVIKECTKKLRAGVHLQLFSNSVRGTDRRNSEITIRSIYRGNEE